jgi:hypothetical protein
MARIIVKNLNSLETGSKHLADLTSDEAIAIHGGMTWENLPESKNVIDCRTPISPSAPTECQESYYWAHS